jgi:hypothetical protein
MLLDIRGKKAIAATFAGLAQDDKRRQASRTDTESNAARRRPRASSVAC